MALTTITPRVKGKVSLCMESKAPPCAMVVFGASGDLTRRKLLTGFFELAKRGLLDERMYILGCGRTHYSDDEFRAVAKESITKKTDMPDGDLDKFLQRLHYVSGDYKDPKFYEDIKKALSGADAQHFQPGPYIFYLALPPELFPVVLEHIGCSGLKAPDQRPLSRIVVEKPFGHDYNSAVELNKLIRSHVGESQIYRIDHYLAKETVQNILIFRFANSIFEPVWNRNYIDHVQITIAESIGVEHRAGYYDTAGALRDIFQNHMLQVLSLIGMEPPASFEADRIRDEKVKLFRSIRPIETAKVVRGQYIEGIVKDKTVPGYRQEPGVRPDSNIETYAAAKLYIDNWRWKGVPFYLRTGKRLSRQVSEIAITFKQVPHLLFESSGIGKLDPTVLVIEIQPNEGISLSFQAKSPGAKTCISQLSMAFTYKDVFKADLPDAYERVLLDCMSGDQTLFTRTEDVEIAWQLLEPVLEKWASDGDKGLEFYPAGSDNFAIADVLMQTDDRLWRPI
ncbi:MAG: glucose-6-phosphate dehydrogenase [Planctomycetes bacterium GWF2_50_10]|nr:MAG: glucose-6-phosphate dehydrogenase [Planctomycetes bacterium GWF2_50_10]